MLHTVTSVNEGVLLGTCPFICWQLDIKTTDWIFVKSFPTDGCLDKKVTIKFWKALDLDPELEISKRILAIVGLGKFSICCC